MSRTARLQAERLARREAALALRPALSPPGPAPDRLRLATWNLNSLRVRLPGLERFLDRAQPDVVCLQETRAATIPEAAASALAARGYAIVHRGSGSSNGVAVLARHPVRDAEGSGDLGDELLDREARVVACVVEAGPTPVRVVSVYVPHGREVGHWHYEYKLAFLGALRAAVARWAREPEPLVLAGDVNVAPTDGDVFHPDAFAGSTHVSAPERAALRALLDDVLVDADATLWGADARRFTWWRYGIGYPRNLGMRIDLLAVDRRIAGALDTTWVDHVERGADRPSDHAALVVDLDPARLTAGRGPAPAG